MDAYKITAMLVVLLSCLIYSCSASACSSEKDCLHFEYCCKGNCTSKRIRCHRICETDHQCQRESRCVLGICVNCTVDFPCKKKTCRNDSHCPSGHSCEKKSCEVKKQSNLTAEMAPFLIFITALSVSLLIVCYNDYFVERFGHRGWRERLGCMYCSCSLTLWFWMWRFRRSRQRNTDDASCPEIEVQFDYRVSNPSNTFNEKPLRQTFWPSRSLNRILFFWRRDNEDIVRESSPLEGNSSEELTRNVQGLPTNPVILLNQFMNTNDPLTASSSTLHQLSRQTTQNPQCSRTERIPSENTIGCSFNVEDSSRIESQMRLTRSSDEEPEANNQVKTSIITGSREVTTV
jgi:hypothetical protein